MKLKLTQDSVAAIALPNGKVQLVVWDDGKDRLPGFGVVVGKATRTFICERRVDGAKVRTKIGVAGHVREDGRTWTVQLAKIEATKVLGVLASGVNPNAKPEAPTGPTLREAVDTHLAKMRKKGRAERSIGTFIHETGKYLADWLDKPIAELTGAKLIELHQEIKDRAAKRVGTNPLNDKGAPIANRVVAHVSASWRSLNKKLEGALGSWNPASAVDKDTIKPKRERVADEDLPGYMTRVGTMHSAIRRDGLKLALYTGLRHEDVRTIRFDSIDWDESTLHMPNPKGGEGAAFTIPLSKTPLEILKRREKDNPRDLGKPDEGWCFPGINHDGVGAISDLRQLDKDGRRFPTEDVHSLRRTWESIANDEGVSELDQHVLSNHAFGSHNVNATYISQHIDHLAACADKIDAGITRRIKGTPSARKRKLRSVA